jgi:glycine/D-amino acid oxidase-like deaminating enzyme
VDGFTRLSSALHLTEPGVDVAVLEAHEPGWGVSGRNGGQVNPGLKHDPDEVERDLGRELGRRMVDFAWNAPNLDIAARNQIQCEARQSGTLRAAFSMWHAPMIRSAADQALRALTDYARLMRSPDESG